MNLIQDNRPELALDTLQALIAVSFIRSSSWAYAPAVEVAKQAWRYEEIRLGKSLVHCATFGRGKDEAARAYSCLRYAWHWKGTQVYAGGQLCQNIHRATAVLGCYLNALACSAPAGYCCYVEHDMVIPCQQLRAGWLIYDSRLGVKGDAQLEAAMIRRGVNWCPALDMGACKRVEA